MDCWRFENLRGPPRPFMSSRNAWQDLCVLDFDAGRPTTKHELASVRRSEGHLGFGYHRSHKPGRLVVGLIEHGSPVPFQYWLRVALTDQFDRQRIRMKEYLIVRPVGWFASP